MPPKEVFEAMGKFNEELVKAGVMLGAEGLHPSSKGARIRFSKGAQQVTRGPFAETNELVAGFWLWNVKSLDEALAWIKRSPFQDAEVELRPVFSPEDFGDALTPELRAQEERLRAETSRRAQS
jgi:hypothetical protein